MSEDKTAFERAYDRTTATMTVARRQAYPDPKCGHIKALRLRTGLTQDRFAGLLGMDQRNYSHLETGGHVPTKSQIAAARMVAFIWERELMVELLGFIGSINGEVSSNETG